MVVDIVVVMKDGYGLEVKNILYGIYVVGIFVGNSKCLVINGFFLEGVVLNV